MTCATNPWLNYNQCSGVTPTWFIVNDGCNNPCGCLPQSNVCNPIRRRFSPFCKLIDVTPAAPQVYLRIAPSPQTDSQALTFSYSRVTLELRRKGCETMIASYPAWRRDGRGYIGFYFDDNLFNGPSGYYIGDVFIDCVYCFSVNFRKPMCEAFVTDCYVQPALDTCGTGECGVALAIGADVIGGTRCGLPVPANQCGPIAPYFQIDNPPPPPPVCDTSSACCFVPAKAIGFDCIG